MAKGSVTNWLSNQVDVLNNVAANMWSVQHLITGAAYLMGVGFAFKALYTLKIYGEARTMMSSHTSIKEPVFYFIVAGMLLYFPTGVAIVLNTTFGSSSILEYAAVDSNNQVLSTFFGGPQFGRPLSIIIQTIGGIAFIRGWMMIARSASQGQPPGGTGKGLMHVFGGILAMNIVATLQIINNTLYGV
ncbi:MAG: type IV secretion protein IcmC [Legionella sp.]|nr:type IV secretion protein IcmC [Legionella sp.]